MNPSNRKRADNVYRPYHLVKVEDVTQGTAALQIGHILKFTIQQITLLGLHLTDTIGTLIAETKMDKT
jgi:hypothetical protein